MNRLIMKKFVALTLGIAFVLSACTSPEYHDAMHNIHKVQHEIQDNTAHNFIPQIKPRVKDYSEQINSIEHPRNWLKKRVTLHAVGLSFRFVVNKITRHTGAMVSYDNDVRERRRVSMHYAGTVRGALEYLSNKTGYAYSVSGNQVSWHAIITKAFDVSFMPGAAEYSLGKSNHGGGNGLGGEIGLNSDKSQYSNLHGSVSIWSDLEHMMQQLKSRTGQIFVSEATTTVTVHDKPQNVRAIAQYLTGLNKKLSREVALSIQVLNVSLNDGFNYGIDWKLAYEYMNMNFGISGNLGHPVSLTPLGHNTATHAIGSAAGFIFSSHSGRFAGTSVLVNAINQQGRVSTVTRPRVVTLNNQVAEIDINTQTGYLKSVSTTTQGVGYSNETSLIPGTIKTGFTLYVLPKIESGRVYLQISSVISHLVGITSVSANPNKNAEENSRIELPTVMEKRFNQRTLVPSGSTLVLAGFKQVNNEASRSQMFRLDALGGRGAKQNNIETIILITPTIIYG